MKEKHDETREQKRAYEELMQELLRLARVGARYEYEAKLREGEETSGNSSEDEGADKALLEGENQGTEVVLNEGLKEELAELFEKYPIVRTFRQFEHLPRGFAVRLKDGMRPVEAWEAYMADVERLENVFVNQMVNGKGKAAPSMKSKGEAYEDVFVKSLFGM